MTDNQPSGRGWPPWKIVAVALPAAIVIGVVAGVIATGGLSSSPGSSVAPPAPTTTTSAPAQTGDRFVEVEAIEDTYVDGSNPDVGHGLESTLKIENDPPEVTQALIRFEVSGIPDGETVSQAVLRLTVDRESEAPIEIRLVSGEWDSTTTFLDAPEAGEVVGTLPPGTAVGAIVEADVTSAVSGNGTVELYLTTMSDDSSEFGSVDSSAKPQLAVAWGGTTLMDPVAEDVSAPGDTVADEEAETSTTVRQAGPTTEELELTGDRVVLVGAGDIADCDDPGDEETAPLVESVLDGEPEAVVFTAGDNAYDSGTVEEFAECFDPTWGRFKDRIRPSVGNHDLVGEPSGYYSYFGEAAGNPGEGYYSLVAGDWLIVMLNSVCGTAGGCEEGSDQEVWLRAVLEEADTSCVLAVYHHPLFSSGEHGGDGDTEALFTALYEAGADVVVTGHDHNYERFAPQDPEGNLDLDRGIRQFIVGTGGKGPDPVGEPEPNSEVLDGDTLGVIVFELYDGGYQWNFMAVPGSSFTDDGANSCH